MVFKQMKNILLAIFFIFVLSNNAIAENFYFKKCDFSKDYNAEYVFDFDNKVINVSFISKENESTREWADKIERVVKQQVISEKIQSKSGEAFFFPILF